MRMSETNVLWILYGPEQTTANIFKIHQVIEEFVSTRRLDFVARAGFNMIYLARQRCEEDPTGCTNSKGKPLRVFAIGFR